MTEKEKNLIIRLEQAEELRIKLMAVLQTKSITAIEGLNATTVEDAIAELKEKIVTTVSSVYRPAGTITAAELLPALLVDGNSAKVYNLTDDATTTADWIDGAGKTVKAGTDVAIIPVENEGAVTYKFNAMAGHIDLSGYKTKQSTVADPDADGNGLTFIDSVSQNANGEVTLHKKTVQTASTDQAGVISAADYKKLETIAYATNADIDALFE